MKLKEKIKVNGEEYECPEIQPCSPTTIGSSIGYN
jgi:hypothetical protein